MGDDKPERWIPKRVGQGDAQVGAVLRAARERAGMTLDETADSSPISKPVISRIERGERACRVQELGLLAAAYGVNAGLLVDAVMGDAAARKELGLDNP
ncbi:helix-turn-helix transcriptional regulator [Mycolicibacterium peregrinum]|uniref:helix-turn-helix domain-containing protein n=1 Tax=Mycolicibacterium peregrinum TaxID=43304 RepID=UPI0006D7B108|nr:helix-turn-helix transcriptional regulator [Mycolicibacterium peregrinum]MCV7204923.1 helix-turn-helix transcriptional regulator [Mycolicibacterium peregrinum]ORW59497.1 DNA-binding protein [Mycolicibacterium peregrinum]